jgi:hypothetical protein
LQWSRRFRQERGSRSSLDHGAGLSAAASARGAAKSGWVSANPGFASGWPLHFVGWEDYLLRRSIWEGLVQAARNANTGIVRQTGLHPSRRLCGNEANRLESNASPPLVDKRCLSPTSLDIPAQQHAPGLERPDETFSGGLAALGRAAEPVSPTAAPSPPMLNSSALACRSQIVLTASSAAGPPRSKGWPPRCNGGRRRPLVGELPAPRRLARPACVARRRCASTATRDLNSEGRSPRHRSGSPRAFNRFTGRLDRAVRPLIQARFRVQRSEAALVWTSA